ncbi:DUF6152 family protein [Candidatus Rariloculus sp.]|uniref:DUF6152 family protein n=1 Tax=Candidatus Rariloculus sp. TaxID=3101265 RepID=UPI003D0AFF1C
MRNQIRLLVCCAFAGLTIQAWAHHSAAQFDFGNRVPVMGTVKLIEVRNPHIKLILDVRDDAGQTKEIEFEGHSRNNVFRRGWRPNSVGVGDEVTIEIAPLRDGSGEGGYITAFQLADGTGF